MRSSLLLIILSFFTFNIQAQLGFEDHVITEGIFSTGDGFDVFCIDLDNDGDMDILSATNDWSSISWYENLDGLGAYSLHKELVQLDAVPQAVYAGDMDGDGKIDIIGGADNLIFWFKNYGDGIFSSAIDIFTFSQTVTDLYTGDLDGDGDLDILSTSQGDDILRWHENTNGLGDFAYPQTISNDMDFTLAANLGDLDGDGDLDVIGTDYYSDKVVWFINDGLGNFGDEQIISTDDIDVNSVHVDDIDGDGDLDLITVAGNHEVRWYKNIDGLGDFEKIVVSNSAGFNLKSIYSEDIDGDSDKDIIIGSYYGLSWFENLDGLGNFGTQINLTTTLSDFEAVFAVDVDGDGDMDIVSNDDLGISIAENLDGTNDFASLYYLSAATEGAYAVYSTDIDGDDDLDVVTASYDDNKIAWYENRDGQGDFGPQNYITGYDTPTSLSAADMDGDGDMDVVANSSTTHSVAWFENTDSQGTFSNATIISNSERPLSVFTTDIDGDNDIDVLIASFNDDRIAWFENDGSGGFGSTSMHSITTSADGSRFVTAADIDGDGDMDVLSTSIFDHKTAWYENLDGQGNFSAQMVISTDMQGPASLATEDIDNDGDLDVVCASNHDNKISWFENLDGLGSFGSFQLVTSLAEDAISVSISDMDFDGDMDIVSASSLDNKIAWYENLDGQGGFGSQQIISINALDAKTVFTADINGDGKSDVLSASQGDSKIAWYENLGIVSNEINGFVKLDVDNNGCDNTDVSLSNIMVIAQDGGQSFGNLSSPNGYYQVFPPAGNYTVGVNSNLPNFFDVNPTSYNFFFNDIGATSTGDFCLTANAMVNDLNITLLPIRGSVPGFDAEYQLVCQNAGSTTLSGNISLDFDGEKISFVGADQPVDGQTANSVDFNITNLNPFESIIINLDFLVLEPPAIEVGDTLVFEATVNPVTGDVSPIDNTFTLEQVTVGAVDPNDKTVLEGTSIFVSEIDKYLHYVIRFQNVGTAEAVNIKINDTLDDKLDGSTLQILTSSHDNIVSINNGKFVTFQFDNILLPDSTTNEALSQGYVAYKIKLKEGVAIGDLISNTASIFFDFNLPIITNTVTTEIIDVVKSEEIFSNNILVYPNPVGDVLYINKEKGINKITIRDVLGQTILIKENLQDNHIELDISNLVSGVYFCTLEEKDGKLYSLEIIKK